MQFSGGCNISCVHTLHGYNILGQSAVYISVLEMFYTPKAGLFLTKMLALRERREYCLIVKEKVKSP